MARLLARSFIVNGSIGVGKSTTIRCLQKIWKNTHPSKPIRIFLENTQEWENYHGINLLKESYDSQTSKTPWIMRFQMKVIMDIMRQEEMVKQLLPNTLCIQERDLESVKKVFVPNSESRFEAVDFLLIKDLLESSFCKTSSESSKISIFLDADVHTCFDRVKKRSRESERNLDFALFRQIHDRMQVLKESSDYILDTRSKSADQVAEEILPLLLQTSNNMASNYFEGNEFEMEQWLLKMEEPVQSLQFEIDHPDAFRPTLATEGSVGYDFRCTETVVIRSRTTKVVSTNVRISFPHTLWMKLHARSSLARQGLLVMGGVIDSDYEGPIMFCFRNLSSQSIVLERGEKMGQGTLHKAIRLPLEEKYIDPAPPGVENYTDDQEKPKSSGRGEGGFGSTGRF